MPSLAIGEDRQGLRLDVALSSCPDFQGSRSFVQKVIDMGMVTVNGRTAKASYRLRAGDEVQYEVPPPLPSEALPEHIPLEIIYEDSHIVVINKQRGMVVHPAAGNRSGTLVNALLARCPDLRAIGDRVRPGIVHRLDKDTTGLLVVAKDEASLKHLQAQIKDRSAVRRYLALVWGVPENSGVVNAPIGRDPKNRKRMAVVQLGRPAVTRYRLVSRLGRYSLVIAELATGRTHQIRVHMAHIGCPVAADPVYGNKRDQVRMSGQALHAYELRFVHPANGRQLLFRAPLPDDFMRVLISLGMDMEKLSGLG